jgi:hypothetical protein
MIWVVIHIIFFFHCLQEKLQLLSWNFEFFDKKILLEDDPGKTLFLENSFDFQDIEVKRVDYFIIRLKLKAFDIE